MEPNRVLGVMEMVELTLTIVIIMITKFIEMEAFSLTRPCYLFTSYDLVISLIDMNKVRLVVVSVVLNTR